MQRASTVGNDDVKSCFMANNGCLIAVRSEGPLKQSSLSPAEVDMSTCDLKSSSHNSPSSGDNYLADNASLGDVNSSDDDDRVPWFLPKGAAPILRLLAAQQIFVELTTECYRCHRREQQEVSTNHEKLELFDSNICSQSRNGRAERKLQLISELVHLLEEFPGICHVQYPFDLDVGESRQLYPLAILSCLDPSVQLVTLTYKAFPKALYHAESVKGSRPLHYACSFQASLEVIQFLLSHDPSSISCPRTSDGMLPLHLASYFQAHDVVSLHLLAQWPEAAQVVDDGGWSPLHAAAAATPLIPTTISCNGGDNNHNSTFEDSSTPSLSLIQGLYNENPAALEQADQYGRTPLHLACWHKGKKDVVAFLVQHAPHVLHRTDGRFETCLFRAARSQSLSVLQLLLQASADLDQNELVDNGNAENEDHDTISDNLNRRVEQTDDSENRDQERRADPPPLPPVDELGATLLHFAVLDNTPDVVQYLMQVYPSMITTRTEDRDQYLPLHTACHFRAPVANVQALVQASPPRTLVWKTGQGQLPQQLAVLAVAEAEAEARSSSENNETNDPTISVTTEQIGEAKALVEYIDRVTMDYLKQELAHKALRSSGKNKKTKEPRRKQLWRFVPQEYMVPAWMNNENEEDSDAEDAVYNID